MHSAPQDRGPIKKDVIIIGAGASGIFCAIECGKRSRSVLVLDHAERICSKVLISGGGRCNFTNLNVTADHYLSANLPFCHSALARFTPQDMLALLKKHKITYFEKEFGKLFCIKSSREIVTMLKNECRRVGVAIQLNCRVAKVQKEGNFIVSSDQGVFLSNSLVIASGGLSYQNLGATGFGHSIARQFGLEVTELKPGLVPFTFSHHDQKIFWALAGISLVAVVRCGGREFRGNILFTHRGLSGPASLQASSYWKKGEAILIDLLPDTNVNAVLAAERKSRIELKTFLARWFPKRFGETWCDLVAPSKPIIQYSDKDLKAIEARLHAWEIKPQATEGYHNAEVTVGGVDTAGISSKTMEARTTPGLYFIGEVLDVTGHLGGYNLHWAWASGHAAGQYA
jgi:predicted Rossmann fold flavoprotein